MVWQNCPLKRGGQRHDLLSSAGVPPFWHTMGFIVVVAAVVVVVVVAVDKGVVTAGEVEPEGVEEEGSGEVAPEAGLEDGGSDGVTSGV